MCELGAGLGLPGIVAALLGARHVALTDLPQALPLLAANVERNGVGHVCSVEQLDWGAQGSGGGGGEACSSGSKGCTGAEEGGRQQQQQQQQGEGAQHAERVRQQQESSCDVVLAADVVYVSALAPLLADVVAGVLAAGGVAVVGHTVRKSVGCQRWTGVLQRCFGKRTVTVVSGWCWAASLAQELTVGPGVAIRANASADCRAVAPVPCILVTREAAGRHDAAPDG